MSTPADFWNDQPVIPVVVINNADNAVELARTLVASGTKKLRSRYARLLHLKRFHEFQLKYQRHSLEQAL